MILLLVLCLLFTFTSSHLRATLNITWPEKYAGHVSVVHIKSGLVKEMDIWVAPMKSRIDYNKGAVKSIYSAPDEWEATKYEIHPETSIAGRSFTKCHIIRERWPYLSGLETLFPDVQDFKMKGEEMMGGKECIKLEKVKTFKRVKRMVNQTMWVYLDSDLQAFLPVRLDDVIYNTLLGKVTRYDITTFQGFHNNFDTYKEFCVLRWCPYEVTHKSHDESVTKHLMFIDPENQKHVNHVFNAFKKHYNRSYVDHKEHALRKQVFQDNMRFIRLTNLQNLGYKLAVNRFTDRLPEEMKKYTGRWARPDGDVGTHNFPYSEGDIEVKVSKLPKNFDLRDGGYVTKVENQEDCGSCWSYATTSTLEGVLARKLGIQKKLATQALIDCAWEFGAGGCAGGMDSAAYKMMMKYGLPTEAEYGTYAGDDGYCKINNMNTTYKIRGFVDVLPVSVSALKLALYEHGPISVSVHTSDGWRPYSSGIFYDPKCNSDYQSADHEVTLIGYGESNGDPYWVIKNSWGQEWGQSGYMQISAKDNNCGLMNEPAYVLL